MSEPRSGRVARLGEFTTPTLEAVERRRGQLWLLAAFVLVALAAGMVLLTFEDSPIGDVEELIPIGMIRVLFVLFVAVLALYLFSKESDLKKLQHSLIDERVLSAALSNRLKEITVLSEVGRAINQLLDLHDVLDLILESSLDLLRADEGSIMLLEPGENRLRVAHARGQDKESLVGKVVEVGRGIAGWVAANREPVLISGKPPEGTFKSLEEKERSISSAICVPLLGQGELYGVLNLNLYGRREFTEYDLRAVQLFAEHAAIAIRNARAFEQERRTITRLEDLDRMKTEFVAAVSHELRTPLTSIIGSAKTMRRRGEQLTTEQRREFLEVIERQGERLLRMVGEILTAARIEAEQRTFGREQFDVARLTRQIVVGFRAGGPINPVDVEAPESLVMFGDPQVLEQVLTNLLENAAKYSGNEQPITVTIERSEGSVEIEVADRGVGIDEENLPTIFDRFRQLDQSTTRQGGGVGLGLYIVKNLVEAVGGTISVTSKIGIGSRFRVSFPIRKEEA